LYLLIFTIFAGNLASSGRAQDKPIEKTSPTTTAAPTPGPRAEFLEEIAYYEQRFTRLAEAMPAEKYAWRPGEGVRSVGEVLMHIAAANYGVARALGTAVPCGVDLKAIQARSTDKRKVVQELKESFAHLRNSSQA